MNERYAGAKKTLEGMKYILLYQIGHTRNQLAENSATSADRIEASEYDNERDVNLALLEMKVAELDRVVGALTRLEEGNYGKCHECGEGIAPIRLRALPFAIRCKDCEKKMTEGYSRAHSVQRVWALEGDL